MMVSWLAFLMKAGATLAESTAASAVVGGIGGLLLSLFVFSPARADRHPGCLDPYSHVPDEGLASSLAQMAFILPVAINAFALLILLGTSFSPKYIEWVLIATPIFTGGQWGAYLFCRKLMN